MFIHFMDCFLKQPDVDFPYSVPNMILPFSRCLGPKAGLVAYLILNASSVGNTTFPHYHSFRPRGRNFSEPPHPTLYVSASGFFFELPLTSRFAHSYKPFKVGKKHLLSAHPLENQTQNKHLQCAWMLWNVREGQQCQRLPRPVPTGKVVRREHSGSGCWECCMAQCIIPSSSSSLATERHLTRLPLLSQQFLLSAPAFLPSLPLSLAALLSLQTTQSSVLGLLALFHLHSTPWRTLQIPAFNATYEPTSPRSTPPEVPGWLAWPSGGLLSCSDLTQPNQSS